MRGRPVAERGRSGRRVAVAGGEGRLDVAAVHRDGEGHESLVLLGDVGQLRRDVLQDQAAVLLVVDVILLVANGFAQQVL